MKVNNHEADRDRDMSVTSKAMVGVEEFRRMLMNREKRQVQQVIMCPCTCYAFPPVRDPAARRFPPLPDRLLFLLFLHVSQNQDPSGHTVNPIHDKWNYRKS